MTTLAIFAGIGIATVCYAWVRFVDRIIVWAVRHVRGVVSW